MSEIARDDLALDALAAGRLPDGDDEVFGLLGALRADLDEPVDEPAPVVVPLKRKRRPFAAVALSAAAGLIIGGFAAGAVVTSDQPGELFYAAHKAVLGDPKAADRVTRLLDDAAEELAEGDRRGALKDLQDARERLADVEDPAVRRLLQERLDRLTVIASQPAPSASPSADDDRETPEPGETESPDDDNSGSGSGSDDSDDSDNSGSGSDGSGSDDSDSSGSGSSGSGSDSDSSGKGSGDDVLKTLDPDKADDDKSGSGGDDGD
jgi:uncharacterized membrane protein YgcG